MYKFEEFLKRFEGLSAERQIKKVSSMLESASITFEFQELLRSFEGLSEQEKADKVAGILKEAYDKLQFQELLKSFEGLSEQEKVDKIDGILEEEGIKPVVITSHHGRKMAYYVGEDTVFAAATLPNGRGVSFTLIDRCTYDKHLADENSSFCFVSRRAGDAKVRVYAREYTGIELHQLVMKDAGYDLAGKSVDHKFHHPQINTADALRVCTNRDNRGNSRYLNRRAMQELKRKDCDDWDERVYKAITDSEKQRFGDYAYNPLTDFTDTWYGFVLYKMLRWGTLKDLEDYNRSYFIKHDKVMMHYYWDILSA
ncbi:MAG: hypothetical protein NC548_25155 [Lachnospiraceae bacterium]|nr:hypothetical protein [Lachnospiraceae bacterium]